MDHDLFMQRFICRTDLYGVQRRGRHGKCYYRPEQDLSVHDLTRHFNGTRTLACYTGADSTTKWMVIDIDTRDELALAAVQERFHRLDLPYLLEFSGRKGFHLWTFFSLPVKNEQVRRLGKTLCDAHELFPKQDLIRDGPGNLIKLPLGVHRVTGRRCWFLDPDTLDPLGDQWQALRDVRLVSPEELRRLSPPPAQAQRERRRWVPRKGRLPSLLESALHRGVGEGRRNRTAFLLATALNQLGHGRDEIKRALFSWNERNDPPLDPRELKRVIASATRGRYAVSIERLERELTF